MAHAQRRPGRGTSAPTQHMVGAGADRLIVARQRAEAMREQMQAHQAYYATADLHSRFEQDAPASIRRRAVARAVLAMRKEDQARIEERRDKLRALLDEDTARWRRELLSMESTSASRVDEMRQRVAELKAKREEERLKIVEEKLEQQRRLNCDELRTHRSKALTRSVTAARSTQLAEKQRAAHLADLDKQRYDAQWESQRLAKVAAEEAAQARRRAADLATVRELEAQIAAVARLKLREKELERDEAAVVAQEIALADMRDAHAKAKQAAAARAARAELEQSTRDRAVARAREAAAALEADLQWIQQLAQLDAEDKAAHDAHRDALRKDLAAFRETVLAQRAAAAQRAADLDRAYAADAERVARARAARAEADAKARERLMLSVMAARAEQLAARRASAAAALADARREREELERSVEAQRRAEDQERLADRLVQLEYQEALLDQMEDRKWRDKVMADEEQDRLDALRSADREYQEWLQRELARPLSAMRVV
ncbi:Cilia- and flagella-associated protein 53 [Allomyces javanicus]|nr:Cilia- and flagella-associated protein 53 [Allomyces javanicus]